MKVRVTAPAFCDHSALDDYGHMVLAEGATLSAVIKKLKIPLLLKPLIIITVNYEKVKPATPLIEGDQVSVYWPISSG